MNDLPDDVLRMIFGKCSAATLACLESTCSRFRRVAASVDSLRLHITPRICPRDSWFDARAERLTKISMRRVYRHVFATYFPNVRVVDIMYTTVRFWNDPQFCSIPRLEKLRVCCLSRRFGQPDVFRTSLLPSTLKDVFLTFDDTWRRVDIDRSFCRLAIRCHEGRVLFRQPDFHVTSLDGCSELYLKTFGCVTSSAVAPPGIVKTIVESEDNHTPTSVLRWFDKRLETAVFRFPASSFVFSQDLAHLDPASLEVFGAFVAVDAIAPRLRRLKVRCRRLANACIPQHVRADLKVHHDDVPDFFFRS